MFKGKVNVLGADAYRETSPEITYLGPEWAANPVVKRDVSVRSLILSQLPQERHHELLELETQSTGTKEESRLKILLYILDVDIDWHMHEVSDGERRRVQILLGLLNPYRLLLLDEVTVDLDVVVRRNLLQFLSDQGQTVLYATHIFDGLGDWPTHLAHIRDGEIIGTYEYEELLKQSSHIDTRFNSVLLSIVEKWLREDFNKVKRKGKKKTVWDRLSEDVKQYGDKYYNYWNQ